MECFTVIDNKTGNYPDCEEIALNEDWAKHLCYCDIDNFAITEDGSLILVDDCGKCAYCPEGRFTIVTDNNVGHKWISVKEHLPQENEPEGATCEQVQVLLDNGAVSTGWCNRHAKLWWHLNYGETHFIGYDYEHTPVIAWQPLAQPPKGE